MRYRSFSVFCILCSVFWLTACSPADPALVARAVEGTLTAVPTQTPVVVVVTVVNQNNVAIPTATPAAVEATATPVSEATPTATPVPSNTPSLTATLLPTTVAFNFPTAPPLFSDDFTQSTAWTLGEDAARKIEVAEGQLRFTIKQPDTFRFVYNPDRRARDFVATVLGGQTECAFRDRYGLLFRVRDNANYYQFEVDCDGRYRFSKTEAGAFTVLKDWTTEAAINTGSSVTNLLIVQTKGPAIELFANGQSILAVNDSSFTDGGFGLYVGSNPNTGFTATFDDFRVWEVK